MNEQANSGIRNSTPAQAIDSENRTLQFSQLEFASENLQKSQRHADKVREKLEEKGAFRKPVQGGGLRKAPRKGDPNYEGVVEKIEGDTRLEGGMTRNEERGIFIPQGNVLAVPRNSKSVDIFADRNVGEDRQRAALEPLRQAMRQYLAGLENEEHANRGMRKAIAAQMEGGDEAYEAAFRAARMGKTFPKAYTESARIARLADLFPRDFERINRGLGSERISVKGRQDASAAPPRRNRRAERAVGRAANLARAAEGRYADDEVRELAARRLEEQEARGH